MTTRIIISLDIPDAEFGIEDILPDWQGDEPPDADDVLAEMKRSVHIYRMLCEWGLDGTADHVHIQVNTTNDQNRRVAQSYAEWDQHERGRLSKAV